MRVPFANHPAAPVASPDDSEGHVLLFLQGRCLITGYHNDFTRSRDVNAAYLAFMEGARPLGPRAIAARLRALSDEYRCPSSKGRFWPAKSNNTGYRGLRLVA